MSPPAPGPITGKPSLWMLQKVPGHSGPASFQRRLESVLVQRGYRVLYSEHEAEADALLVVGGSRHLGAIRGAKRRGMRLVQRLNGMNWIHRRRPTGFDHYLRAELNNLLLRIIRRMADVVVYQSSFARDWWERKHGATDGELHVVHNGVPLRTFSPEGGQQPPHDHVRMAVVEGRFGGGYEVGLEWAISLARSMEAELDMPVELAVAGQIAPKDLQRLAHDINWQGTLDPAELPALLRSSHLLFSADLHPACPNSVLEALACGCPVAAFDTGAIGEIVTPAAGAVVPFGSDPWIPETPAIEELARAAAPLVRESSVFRVGARRRAETAFSAQRMTDGYLHALGWE